MEFRKRRETPPADGPLPLGELLRQVKRQAPLVHCITNYVTARDCANLLLACGASPVMADDVEEVAEITAVSSGLYLNLGALHRSSASAMLAAGTGPSGPGGRGGFPLPPGDGREAAGRRAGCRHSGQRFRNQDLGPGLCRGEGRGCRHNGPGDPGESGGHGGPGPNPCGEDRGGCGPYGGS